jgi:outer membrane protein OmpA-like peptidoglycan-associated protein
MRKIRFTPLITLFALILLAAMTAACYRRGALEVRTIPPEAYVYLDGVPMADGTASGDNNLILDDIAPGEHTVNLYNYGYKPEVQKVTITEDKLTHLDIDMTREGGPTSGPWGRIIMEGPPHAMVFLNGKTPEFFVGHVDEFDKDLVWRGQLIVPPGTHQVTVMDGGATVWSGTVTVAANQTVNVHLKGGGTQTTTNWSQGAKLSNMWPFRASLTSTTVVVAPVTGQFSVNPAQVSCGGSTRLSWSSTGAVSDQISDVGDVPASGDREVQPKQTTTYKFTAAGPGGIHTSDATVTVSSAIQASLSVSPTEVRYHAIGEKVDQQGSATVTWSAAGADTVSLDPFGSVGTSGDRTLQATPSKTTPGPVDETVTYTLRATNACGGTETRTATLHIVGSIEESRHEPEFNADSIYFPYDLPSRAHPERGLLPGEQNRLNDLVTFFKQYLEFRPEAHLILEGHADRRGSIKYNKALSQRRADRIKSYLVDKGVPGANIETDAFGKLKNLTRKEVLELNDQNPNLTPQDRKRIARAIAVFTMANNRRVDIKVSTTGKESHRYFPYNSNDEKGLVGRRRRMMKRAAQEKAPETK